MIGYNGPHLGTSGLGDYTITVYGRLGDDFQPIVVLYPDGSVKRGPAFTTNDEAAIAFWAAVERLRPKRNVNS